MKYWIRRRGELPAQIVDYSAMRLDYVDAVDTPAIAVPLDLMERLVDADRGVNRYTAPEELDHITTLCREMREEVGHG